jgi:benzodiazapine receptor
VVEDRQASLVATSRLLALAVFVAVALITGWIGSVAVSAGPSAWYGELTKPAFMPSQTIVAIVVPVLYVLMGVGAWLVWLQPGSVPRNSTLAAFFIQLALNAGWSWAFFGGRGIGLALAVIVVLFAAVAWMVWGSRNVSRVALVVFLPVLAGTGFAAALNTAFYLLN